MFKESSVLESFLRFGRKIIPKNIFQFFQPYYHGFLALSGALLYGFPSKKLKVIGITGTKGKSTVVYMLTKIFEEAGLPVAAIGSLGFRIKHKEWPNNLKMTMPGRWKLQKFLAQALKENCKYVVLEVTSEGLRQNRHLGINFDCAVFTNLSKEHIEAHGSFENYKKTKTRLFKAAKNFHIINADSEYADFFSDFNPKGHIFYGIKNGDVKPEVFKILPSIKFSLDGADFDLKLVGEFNLFNALAVIAVAKAYKIDLRLIKSALERIEKVPGRMEFVYDDKFKVVVDYAHTPDSFEAVYKTLSSLRERAPEATERSNLIGVFGATGGGRDKWKRPEFGKIAAKYCDKIILTDEDPYDEDPLEIIKQVESGLLEVKSRILYIPDYEIIIDRKEAIKKALIKAQKGDIVAITGKGSEPVMAVAGGRKIPWSDKDIVLEILK